MASSQQHRCVFVGNIPYDATEEQLIQVCEEVGPVVSFRLVIDRETGKPKGYGFCEYKDEETALSARRNLQGYEINGRQLRVDFAENDKGSGSRDQGRGGPGMVTNVDTQKQVGGPAVIGDVTLHQPIGIPIAMSAASVMTGALGGAQSSQINQNGFQNQAPVGNDPLTHHLAKMSRNQLNQVIHEMKMLGTQNKDLARQLLTGSPHLAKALFQVQIMLGLVTPQMLQMPNIRQQGQNPSLQPSVQLPMLAQQPVLQTLPGLPSFAPLSSVSQSSLPHNQFSAPLPRPTHPRAQLPILSQIRPPPQSAMPAQSGPSQHASVRSQLLAGSQIQAGPSHSFTPVQAPLLQHGGHASQLPISNASLQSSFKSRPMSSDPMYQGAPSLRLGLAEKNKRDISKHTQVMGDAALVGRAHAMANLPQLSDKNDSLDQMVRPAKLARLDDGRSAPFPSAGLAAPIIRESGTSNAVGNSSVAAGPSPVVEAQSMEKQTSQLQLPPDVEAALLQQVLSLTPEKLSSLSPEQQQQVIQLQKMLRSNPN